MKVAAIIPAKDEQQSVGKVVKLAKKYVNEVIVVDDGSSDKTAERAKISGATVLKHIINLGKGAALKTGCEYIISKMYDIILTLDADGQHDPREIPKFLKALNEAEFVIGSRKRNKEMPLIKQIWNFAISKLFSILFGLKLQDEQCGFRAFKSKIYPKIKWESQDYLAETEILINVAKNKISLKEVPIKTIYKKAHGGIPPTYGFRHILAMLLWRLV